MKNRIPFLTLLFIILSMAGAWAAQTPTFIADPQTLNKAKVINGRLQVDINGVSFTGTITLNTNINVGTYGINPAPISDANPFPIAGNVGVTNATALSTNGIAATLTDAIGNIGMTLYSDVGGASAGAPLVVFPAVFNGTTWDRLRGDAGSQYVILTNSPVTVSNLLTATLSGPSKVGGWMLQTNLSPVTDITLTGTGTNAVLCKEMEVNNVNGTGYILSSGVMCDDTGDGNAPPKFGALVCSASITWGDTNTAVALVRSELATKWVGTLWWTNDAHWNKTGTNWMCTEYPHGLAFKCAANSIFLYPFTIDRVMKQTNDIIFSLGLSKDQP